MKCCIVTLGCQMNQSDSERVRSVVEGMGFEMTTEEAEASLIGVIACSVRQKAIDKVYCKIQKWNQWKKSRSLVTFVCGCILPADEVKFVPLFDLVFRMNELPGLPAMLQQYGIATDFSAGSSIASLQGDKDSPGFWQVEPSYRSKFEAFVPIQNGCDKFCSFCAVPYTRGREVSRPSKDILAEITKLIERDVKIITLLGQNVNSYGLDKPGEERSFAELLRAVGDLGQQSHKMCWIYFTSPHPRDMTRDVIEAMADYDCLAKQVHLPLQSGDEKLLRRMNRNHSVLDYLNIVADIRELIPTATLFTDIIVGFCGESDEQFEHTADVMRQVQFNMAYVARYSPRTGTRSARWADDVTSDKKSERLAALSDILKQASLAYNEQLIGKTLPVFVERVDPRMSGALASRTEGKLPVRILDAPEEWVGTFQKITITSASPLSLAGVPLR